MVLRHTKSRQLVLLCVKVSAIGQTAEDILARVRKLQPRIGRATVYRNLRRLTERGEIFRYESEDGVRRYFGHVHHEASFRCQRCGQERRLSVRRLTRLLDMDLFAKQRVFLSRLSAQGLCSNCAGTLNRQLMMR